MATAMPAPMLVGEPSSATPDPARGGGLAPVRTHPDLFGDDAARRRAPTAYGFQVGPGWRPLVLRLLDRLREAAPIDGAPVRIRQIKEKLGELRVYVRGGGEACRAAIGHAEKAAERTYQACGEPGRLRHGRSCVQVVCNEHACLISGGVLEALARRGELTPARLSREVAGIVDGWELDV